MIFSSLIDSILKHIPKKVSYSKNIFKPFHLTSLLSPLPKIRMSAPNSSQSMHIESESEWVDTDDIEIDSRAISNELPKSAPIAKATLKDVVCPCLEFDKVRDIPVSDTLVNFVRDSNGNTLYRDEPVNKEYPGLRFSNKMSQFKNVFVYISLFFENCQRVRVRVPDLKSKKSFRLRRERGVFIAPSDLGGSPLHFKKKCVNKTTGLDAAFELGINYSSHTNGVPSQFVFVLIPFHNGKLALDSAERSEKFYVKSKRQQRFLTTNGSKRIKKSTESLKIETDIQSAKEIYLELLGKLKRVQHDKMSYVQMVQMVQTELPSMPDGAVKVGLQYGSRPMVSEDIAVL